MKKIMGILTLLTLFIALACQAQTSLEVNENGKYRLAKDSANDTWRTSRITAEPAAEAYVDYFNQAITQPGIPVVVKKETAKILRYKPLFRQIREVDRLEIVYNSSDKRIRTMKSRGAEEKKDPVLAALIIFSLLSTIILYIFERTNNIGLGSHFFIASIFITFIAACALIIKAIVNNTGMLSLSGVFVFLAAFAVTRISISDRRELWSVVYLLSIVAAMIHMYI